MTEPRVADMTDEQLTGHLLTAVRAGAIRKHADGWDVRISTRLLSWAMLAPRAEAALDQLLADDTITVSPSQITEFGFAPAAMADSGTLAASSAPAGAHGARDA